MAPAREIIVDRIDQLETLSKLTMTPLLLQYTNHAISLHHKALEIENFDPFTQDLNSSYTRVKEHWKRVNGDMTVAASLQQSITIFQIFLASKLLEDYAYQPYRLEAGMREIANYVKEQGERQDGGEKDQTYFDNFIFPMDEMTLNKEHVKKRLYATAERQGEPGNDVEPLINQGDWATLATTLLYDRELARILFKTSAYTAEQYDSVLQGLDGIENKYSMELKGPTAFTILDQSIVKRDWQSLFTWIQPFRTGHQPGKPRPRNDTSILGEETGSSLKKTA